MDKNQIALLKNVQERLDIIGLELQTFSEGLSIAFEDDLEQE